MLAREQFIRMYFDMWLTGDDAGLDAIMAEDVYYSESHGPEYYGLNQVHRWFADWNTRGAVLQWRIKQFVHGEQITAVEWFFECVYSDEISGFDGVSLVEFDPAGKITSVKEFQSKAEHTQPYRTA